MLTTTQPNSYDLKAITQTNIQRALWDSNLNLSFQIG